MAPRSSGRFRAPLLMSLAALSMAMLAGGCASDGAADSNNAQRPVEPVGPSKPVSPVRPSSPPSRRAASPDPAGTATPKASGRASIPDNARFTLFCAKIATGDHVARGEGLRERMKQADPQRDWYVVHQEVESVLYCGYYGEIDSKTNAREARRAQVDKEAVESLAIDGRRIFPRAIFVPLDSPDPDAPAEWDILKVDAGKADSDPTRAYWTLEIGVYRDDPRRKEAAIEAVRLARDAGVAAYYYHGATSSSVLIGAWPKSAVEIADAAKENRDPDATVRVGRGDKTPSGAVRDRDGRPIAVLAGEPVIRDRTLLKAKLDYPSFAVNGEQDMVRDGNKMRPKPSILRPIPTPEIVSAQTAAPQETVRPIEPPVRSRGGQLRGIGG